MTAGVVAVLQLRFGLVGGGVALIAAGVCTSALVVVAGLRGLRAPRGAGCSRHTLLGLTALTLGAGLLTLLTAVN